MIIIEGSEGEGGGQVVRNACALSLVTGKAVRIENVRAKRSKPGLMRQHVTAVEAACVIGNAECQGLHVGSSVLSFTPGRVAPGEYHFAVGTAGSTGLVLQTVLMPLLLADAPSRVVLEGGTHNMLAPPFDFIEKCFLPVINRMGPTVEARLVRHGFYPRGGGRIEVDISPAPLRPIDCLERGALIGVSGQALLAGLPFEIAEREIKMVRRELGWSDREAGIRELPDDQGPGNILLLEAQFEHGTEIVSGFGQLGVTAERVAKKAVGRMLGFLESKAFAGPYLADQLLLPFALAGGGSFTTVKPSQHSLTAIDVIGRFLDRRLAFSQRPSGMHLLTVQ
ncbi:RNA 3'-terminal phosphate cyclase [Sphingosinicella microcystinivorans]|uniref:RNA 3'-terminal phosphate cyclase n=1 Tax=Sphingosinicella microcystinivorans TaxID=335406 RepID=A0AAD1G148_SPHMI|nr:RNA 3'-terminal phosphate cyclase [Sphingosinicella microcystinivorans]RKS91348.1 RNA 3'-terminal phosphate cyclase (ATP) [Sphingosinicella microcystinivorans]BBE34319.1 RNA 3'-terminal phosphate cyclase [Sphingosinicella microcystinivorans]